jgi:hypothetical protein
MPATIAPLLTQRFHLEPELEGFLMHTLLDQPAALGELLRSYVFGTARFAPPTQLQPRSEFVDVEAASDPLFLWWWAMVEAGNEPSVRSEFRKTDAVAHATAMARVRAMVRVATNGWLTVLWYGPGRSGTLAFRHHRTGAVVTTSDSASGGGWVLAE